MTDKEVIRALDVLGLDLKALTEKGELRQNIYTNYRWHIGGFHIETPLDEYYLLDSRGAVVFIGNKKMLFGFLNRCKG